MTGEPHLAAAGCFDAARPYVAPVAGSRAEPVGSPAPAREVSLCSFPAERDVLCCARQWNSRAAERQHYWYAVRCCCEALHSKRYCREDQARSG